MCKEEKADAEVYPVSVSLLDRFLSVESIYANQLQGLAAACLLVAGKVKLSRPFTGRRLCAFTADSVPLGQLMVRTGTGIAVTKSSRRKTNCPGKKSFRDV